MIKVKDGYAKLIGTTYQGSAILVLLSNGGNLEFSSATKANTLVLRNASLHIYATYFNSAISDEALTDIGSVYIRNTSDTFIRRISKTQFYSIIDNKFVTLDTALTITGVKTFSTGPILANNATITLNLNSTSNYTSAVKWLKGGTSLGTYSPSIGLHNIGGDGTGSICILPYPTETSPWGGAVGLFISKGVLKLDGLDVIHSGNYTSYVLKIGTATVGATNKGIYLNAGTPTAMSASAGSSALPVYMASGAIVACTASSVFSALANSGNNLSITVAGQNRLLVVNYSTYASYLSSWDNRSVNNTPSTYGSSARFEFKANSADGLSNGGSYHGILHFKPYGGTTDFTGGQTHLLGFTDSGNLYMRTSTNSTTWGAWKLLMNEPNANSKYVTALGTSGNYVTWTKNGTTNNLTVPYSVNSDKLDGYHETSFFRARGSLAIASYTPTTTELSSNNNLSGSWTVSYPGASGHLVQFNTGGGSTRYMQFYSHYSGSLYWRNSTDSTLSSKPWKTIVDSANYTGVVLKIGTATKGSATLPIYLNAGTPTACSTTLGVSITGNADTVDGVHVKWAGRLTSTSHLVAWEADGSALRDINPADVTVGNSGQLGGKSTGYYVPRNAGRDWTNGCLVITDLKASSSVPWLIIIEGNSYGASSPFMIQCQGYDYSGSSNHINYGGWQVNGLKSGVHAFRYNGLLCFWFKQDSYWQGFSVRVYKCDETYNYNHVTSVSNSALPARDREVIISPAPLAYISSTVDSATKLKTARNINGTLFNGTSDITTARWGYARTLTLTGSITGSATIDGSGNVSMATTYQAGNIGNLDARYVNVTGDTMTGNLSIIETKNILLRPNHANYHSGIGYDTSGNECIALWAKNTVTRLRWHAGLDLTNLSSGSMMSITPDFEISKASGIATGYIGGKVILHSGNYNSYSPTLTGSGASGTWGISITGTAASARKLYKIDGTSRTWSTSESVVGNGIVAYTDTTTSGRWDSYGSLFLFSNQDNPTPGTSGHWLTQMWSGTSNKLGVRWRTNTGSWSAMLTILTNINYSSTLNGVYVNKTGDTMSGNLTITGTVYTNGPEPIFNVLGNNGINVRSSTNDIGIRILQNATSKSYFGWNTSYGVYMYNYSGAHKLHITDSGTPSFDGNTLLHSGNYTSVLNGTYLPLSGGTVTGITNFTNRIRIVGTVATPAWNSVGITFTENTTDAQAVSFIYTSYDTYRAPAGIKLIGNQGNEWFEAPKIYATTFYGSLSGNATSATNSDKLDGYHASSFLQNFNVGNVNFNTLTTSGVYRLSYTTTNGASNGPTGADWSQMLVMHGGGDTIAQMAISYSSRRVYVRAGNPSNVGGSGSWSSWYTLAFTTDVPTVTNYYWANIKVSASSSTSTSPTFSTAYTSNWFRSTGNTGWYSETYGGGWNMTDTTYIRAYGSKRVYTANTSLYAFYTSGGMTAAKGFWHSAVNSNSYVLLAGGSYKAVSDFATKSHTHSYVPLSGNSTITISKFYGLTLKRSDSNGSAIQFSNSAGALAGIGVLSDKSFVVSSGSTTAGNMFKVTSAGKAYAGGTELSKVGHTHSYLPLAGGTMTGGITWKNGASIAYNGNCTFNDLNVSHVTLNSTTLNTKVYSGTDSVKMDTFPQRSVVCTNPGTRGATVVLPGYFPETIKTGDIVVITFLKGSHGCISTPTETSLINGYGRTVGVGVKGETYILMYVEVSSTDTHWVIISHP